ncbi:DUF2948 family protein [Polymorphobacter sp.]|uniref:DUF2948 family protein n=1 Tax=Polymorphobacter sp. TaxID=1909290 RepID=UPI003F728471
MAETSRLSLLAQSPEDLPPLAALVQDALLRPADIAFDPKARRLVLMLTRYRWEAPTPSRTRSALRLETVFGVQERHWPRTPDTILNLLTLEWAEPYLTLVFSEDITLRARCETLDLILEDVTDPWPSDHVPNHAA